MINYLCCEIKILLKSKFFYLCLVLIPIAVIIFMQIDLTSIRGEASFLEGWTKMNGYSIGNLKGSSIALHMDTFMRMVIPQNALCAPIIFLNRFITIAVIAFVSFQVASDYNNRTIRVKFSYLSTLQYLFAKVLAISAVLVVIYLLTGIMSSGISVYYSNNLNINAEFMQIYTFSASELLINFIKLILVSTVIALTTGIYAIFSSLITLLTRNPFFSIPLILLLFFDQYNPNNFSYLIFTKVFNFDSMGLGNLAQTRYYFDQQFSSILMFVFCLCIIWVLLIFVSNRKLQVL